eukprot:g1295.t1
MARVVLPPSEAGAVPPYIVKVSSDGSAPQQQKRRQGDSKAEQRDAITAGDVLGWCVIGGAVVYKLPQILQIWRSRSADGVVLAATSQDLLVYVFTFAYSLAKGHTFNLYGENFFQGTGTLGVILLQLRFSYGFSKAKLVAVFSAVALATAALARAPQLLGPQLGTRALNAARVSTIFFGLSAKVPQIWSNYDRGDVGQLSLTSSGLNALGSWVRIYTSLKSQALRNDWRVMGGAALSLVLNSVVVGQILRYGSGRSIPPTRKR